MTTERASYIFITIAILCMMAAGLAQCGGGGSDRGDTALECSRKGQPSSWNPSTGKWECGAK